MERRTTDALDTSSTTVPPIGSAAPTAAVADAPVLIANPLVRLAYFVFGCVTFALALTGIVVRGIPTTPFLLLTAFAFARSSPRLHRWLLGHRRFGPILRDLQAGRGLTFRFKAASIAFSWSLMLATAIWLVPSWPIRLFLALAASIQLYVFLRVIPTRPQHV